MTHEYIVVNTETRGKQMEKRKDTFLGLTADEAERSIRENGKNILSKQKKKSSLEKTF